MVFAKQLYVRFKGLGASEANTLQVGRFEFNDGSELAPKNATLATLKRDRISQRLIGTFGWSDVGRSFDGLHYSYSKPTNDFTFVAATPTRGVFQTDGWGWNRVGFGYAAFTHEWGSGNHAADTRVFVLDYDDWRHILKTDNRPVGAPPRRHGKHPHPDLRRAQSARLHDRQRGPSMRSPGEQCRPAAGERKRSSPTLSISRAGISPEHSLALAKLKPWLRGGFTMGSGDGNPER